MAQELNDYTLADGEVLHLDDAQMSKGNSMVESMFGRFGDIGDLDMAQYVAAELTNKLADHKKGVN